MKKEDLEKRFKKEFPEFKWIDKYGDLKTEFALAEISVNDNEDYEDYIEIPMGSKNFIPGIENFIEDTYDNTLTINSINEELFDKIIEGIKQWREHIDSIRKSEDERDQLVLIHPDWDIESFKKDFKIVCGDDMDWRLGIMSTKDWDFSNDDLCRELNENSKDCFAIGLMSERWDSLEEALEDMELTKEYEELKEKYPGVGSITEIYDTDFD